MGGEKGNRYSERGEGGKGEGIERREGGGGVVGGWGGVGGVGGGVGVGGGGWCNVSLFIGCAVFAVC